MVTSARDACLTQPLEQLSGARSPRHRPLDLDHDPVEELLDSSPGGQVGAHLLVDVVRRVPQVVADEVEGVLQRPGAAVPRSEGVLGLDPTGLGVDEGAVHVPQHGRRLRGMLTNRKPWRSGAAVGDHSAAVRAVGAVGTVSHRGRSRGSAIATSPPRPATSPCARRTPPPGHGRAGRPRSTATRGGCSRRPKRRRPATWPSTR